MNAIFVALSAVVILSLGGIHMLYTFKGNKFMPREPGLRDDMERISPVISRETTMWKAWIGFNASHSLGAILFGLLYGYLALKQPDLLFASSFLQGLGLATLLVFLWLAKTYWFRIPLIGIGIALALYVIGMVL